MMQKSLPEWRNVQIPPGWTSNETFEPNELLLSSETQYPENVQTLSSTHTLIGTLQLDDCKTLYVKLLFTMFEYRLIVPDGRHLSPEHD